MSIKSITNHPEYNAKIHPDALVALNKLRNGGENSNAISVIHERVSVLPFQIQALVAKDILRLLTSNWNSYEALVLEILQRGIPSDVTFKDNGDQDDNLAQAA